MSKNLIVIVMLILALSGCSSSSSKEPKNIGEYAQFYTRYYMDRRFVNPEYKDIPHPSTLKGFGEAKSGEKFIIKYYLHIGDDNLIEIPPEHMWYSKIKGKVIFDKGKRTFTRNDGALIIPRNEMKNAGYFKDVYTYIKEGEEYKKFDLLQAEAVFTKTRVPIQYCLPDGWCKTYILPLKRLKKGETREELNPNGILYYISEGLYVKREDVYPPDSRVD